MLDYLPFIIAFVVIFTLIFIVNRKNSKSTYDERQTIARNKAYRCAFAAIMCYFVAGELVTLLSEKDWCTPECNIGIGMFISLGTFVVISIVNDAYIPAVSNNKNKSNLLIITLLGGYQLFMGICSVIDDGIMQNGLLNLPITLCVGVLMVIVVLTQLIKFAFDRKAEKDED